MDVDPVVAVEGETVVVEVAVGPADTAAVAEWLIAEARWWATQLGALLDVEVGSDPVSNVVNANVNDPRPDWAPEWLPEAKD